MEKSCPPDLSEWLDSHPEIRQGLRNNVKVAFLAVKDDVKTALGSGYSMRVVWKYMQDVGKLKCSYSAFCSHVHRHIHQPADEAKAADSSPPTEKPAAEKTPEVKTAKGDDSADSEKAERELEPWEVKFKIANEKIAAMKPNVPSKEIIPPPPPEEEEELDADGRPVDPYAERKRLMRESLERDEIKRFEWNPTQLTSGELRRGKRDDPKDKKKEGNQNS